MDEKWPEANRYFAKCFYHMKNFDKAEQYLQEYMNNSPLYIEECKHYMNLIKQAKKQGLKEFD